MKILVGCLPQSGTFKVADSKKLGAKAKCIYKFNSGIHTPLYLKLLVCGGGYLKFGPKFTDSIQFLYKDTVGKYFPSYKSMAPSFKHFPFL